MICATSASYCGESGDSSPRPPCWANSCTSPRVTSPPSKTTTFFDSGSRLATGAAGSHERARRVTTRSNETNHTLFTKGLPKTTKNLVPLETKIARDYSISASQHAVSLRSPAFSTLGPFQGPRFQHFSFSLCAEMLKGAAGAVLTSGGEA